MNPPLENGFLNKDFRPSTRPRSEPIPNIAQTQHSTQSQHRHMPEGIQTRPRHIRTNASQISENKLDTCAPQPQIQPWQDSAMRSDILSDVRYWHVLSYSIWRINILTCFLAFLSDILSFRRIIWHLIWRSYILSDIYSDVLSGNRHIFRRCIWHCTWQTRFFIKGSWGSNLPSYGWFLPDEGWCETVVWDSTSHNNPLNEGWCETVVWDSTSHNNTLNEGWCETVVWDLTSHSNTLNEGWCETVARHLTSHDTTRV